MSSNLIRRGAALVLVVLAVAALVAVRAGATVPVSVLEDYPGVFAAAPLILVLAAVLLLSYETAARFVAAGRAEKRAKEQECPYWDHLAEGARHAEAIEVAKTRITELKSRIDAPTQALSAAHQRIHRRESRLLEERTRWTRWAEMTARLAHDVLGAYLQLPPYERTWVLKQVSAATSTALFTNPNIQE